MFKLGRRKKPQVAEETGHQVVDNSDDEAIIHETVPDAVLYPDRPARTSSDMSWLGSAASSEARGETPVSEVASDRAVDTGSLDFLKEVPEPAPVAPAARIKRTARAPEPVPSQPPAVAMISDQPANSEAQGRPRFPIGWLVVVEGPGVGEWFVLERGVSHIGRAANQTVRLDFGDGSVADAAHARVSYDENAHSFVVDGAEGLRVNGVLASGTETVRDGDVITVGGTGLRLVALCSQNFNWTSDVAAE